jgi:hypothetical protein
MPVTPVTLELAEPYRKLLGRGFDFLQAQNVGLFAVEKFLELHVAGADSVDVPRGDLHHVEA